MMIDQCISIFQVFNLVVDISHKNIVHSLYISTTNYLINYSSLTSRNISHRMLPPKYIFSPQQRTTNMLKPQSNIVA